MQITIKEGWKEPHCPFCDAELKKISVTTEILKEDTEEHIPVDFILTGNEKIETLDGVMVKIIPAGTKIEGEDSETEEDIHIRITPAGTEIETGFEIHHCECGALYTVGNMAGDDEHLDLIDGSVLDYEFIKIHNYSRDEHVYHPHLVEGFNILYPDLNYQKIEIGIFTLIRMDEETIHIWVTKDGEGGNFNEKKVEEAINKFCNENF